MTRGPDYTDEDWDLSKEQIFDFIARRTPLAVICRNIATEDFKPTKHHLKRQLENWNLAYWTPSTSDRFARNNYDARLTTAASRRTSAGRYPSLAAKSGPSVEQRQQPTASSSQQQNEFVNENTRMTNQSSYSQGSSSNGGGGSSSSNSNSNNNYNYWDSEERYQGQQQHYSYNERSQPSYNKHYPEYPSEYMYGNPQVHNPGPSGPLVNYDHCVFNQYIQEGGQDTSTGPPGADEYYDEPGGGQYDQSYGSSRHSGHGNYYE